MMHGIEFPARLRSSRNSSAPSLSFTPTQYRVLSIEYFFFATCPGQHFSKEPACTHTRTYINSNRCLFIDSSDPLARDLLSSHSLSNLSYTGKKGLNERIINIYISYQKMLNSIYNHPIVIFQNYLFKKSTCSAWFLFNNMKTLIIFYQNKFRVYVFLSLNPFL